MGCVRGDNVKDVRGGGGAYDIQINESCAPLLFLILHGEGNKKTEEGIINIRFIKVNNLSNINLWVNIEI